MEIKRSKKGYYIIENKGRVYNLSAIIKDILEEEEGTDMDSTFLRFMNSLIPMLEQRYNGYIGELAAAVSSSYSAIDQIISSNFLGPKSAFEEFVKDSDT